MTIDYWTSFTMYVDINTGECITETDAKKNYLILKTKKHVTIDQTLQKGKIIYTRLCRRNPQTELKFPNH